MKPTDKTDQIYGMENTDDGMKVYNLSNSNSFFTNLVQYSQFYYNSLGRAKFVEVKKVWRQYLRPECFNALK